MFVAFEVCHDELDSRLALSGGRGGGNGFGGCALVGVLDEEKGVKHVETDDERYDTVGGLVIRLSF
jgi:hypothetical protein